MTNYEKWASTPEAVADLLMQFDPNIRCGSPAVRSFERFCVRVENDEFLRNNPRGTLFEWLMEETSD